jgi:hypothetical protein
LRKYWVLGELVNEPTLSYIAAAAFNTPRMEVVSSAGVSVIAVVRKVAVTKLAGLGRKIRRADRNNA